MISYNISKKTKVERTALILRKLFYALSSLVFMLVIYFGVAFFGSETWLVNTSETIQLIAPTWIKNIWGWIINVDKTILFWIWFSMLSLFIIIIGGIVITTYYTTYDTPYPPKKAQKKFAKLKAKEQKYKQKFINNNDN